MPELPEVETTRLSFVQRIAGAKVHAVRMGKPLRWPLGCDPSVLVGLQVFDVRRRSKYLLIDLSQGMLMLHLGMSGSLRFEDSTEEVEREKHEHFTMHTDKGVLRLIDPRRFGAVVYAVDGEQDAVAQKLLGKLGPEPLHTDFTAPYLYAALRRRAIPIKQAIMDAKVVVGVGNIYASESLFHAGIRPTMPANRITKPKAEKLHTAIVRVLQAALRAGGSSLRNYKSADGEPGYFQLETRVYGRAKQPCYICKTPISLVQLGQRSSFFCSKCQKSR